MLIKLLDNKNINLIFSIYTCIIYETMNLKKSNLYLFNFKII